MSHSPAARDNLEFAGIYRPGTVERVRETIPADVLDVIDNRPGSSWLEFEYDHWLMDGVMEVLGKDAAIRCWRASIGRGVFDLEKPSAGRVEFEFDAPSRTAMATFTWN